MNRSINDMEAYTDIPECMSVQEIQDTTQNDEHLQVLVTYIINS